MSEQEKQDVKEFRRLYHPKDEQTKDYIMAMLSMAAMAWNQAKRSENDGSYHKGG